MDEEIDYKECLIAFLEGMEFQCIPEMLERLKTPHEFKQVGEFTKERIKQKIV